MISVYLHINMDTSLFIQQCISKILLVNTSTALSQNCYQYQLCTLFSFKCRPFFNCSVHLGDGLSCLSSHSHLAEFKLTCISTSVQIYPENLDIFQHKNKQKKVIYKHSIQKNHALRYLQEFYNKTSSLLNHTTCIVHSTHTSVNAERCLQFSKYALV